jgi:hypothetical protein
MQAQKFQTCLEKGPNTIVWEAASSPAHHIQKTNTINKPHDALWCETHGTLPRRGKECDVECVLDTEHGKYFQCPKCNTGLFTESFIRFL